jgi:hypothetical protein
VNDRPVLDQSPRWPSGQRDHEIARLGGLIERMAHTRDGGATDRRERRHEIARLHQLLTILFRARVRVLQQQGEPWPDPIPETPWPPPKSTAGLSPPYRPSTPPKRQSFWDRLRFWKR